MQPAEKGCNLISRVNWLYWDSFYQNQTREYKNMRFYKLTGVVVIISIICFGCDLFGSGSGTTEEYSLTASASPTEGGSVTPASSSFEEGSDVSVEATAADGWAFANWTGDIESNESTLTFSITKNTEVTANFTDRRSVYAVDMSASDSEETINLSFGQAEEATNGFDDGQDEEAPPPPPSDVLHTYFEINNLDLFKNFRSSNNSDIKWTLQYQVDSSKDLTLAWTIADDTKMEGNLTMTDESGSFEVDMLSESSHTVSGSTSGTLTISYSLE